MTPATHLNEKILRIGDSGRVLSPVRHGILARCMHPVFWKKSIRFCLRKQSASTRFLEKARLEGVGKTALVLKFVDDIVKTDKFTTLGQPGTSFGTLVAVVAWFFTKKSVRVFLFVLFFVRFVSGIDYKTKMLWMRGSGGLGG